MAGTLVTSPNQVTRYERKNIWQIIGFISVLILIFAYKLGIDVIPFYTTIFPSYCWLKYFKDIAATIE